MLIGDWMTSKVITVQPDVSMMKASKLMKDNNIRGLPVVDADGKLVGIISDRDIKEASPSKATTLDVHELYYLLSEIKVKDIMTKNPYRVSPNDTMEKAAVLMTTKKIGSLPVVDENDHVLGIISEHDVFQVLITITGVLHGGIQMAFEIPNTEGSLKPILDDLKRHNTRIMSILTSFDSAGADARHVYIRIQDMDKSALNTIRQELGVKYKMLYWVRDVVDSILH